MMTLTDYSIEISYFLLISIFCSYRMQVKYSITDPLVAALALTPTGLGKETDPLFLPANSADASSVSIKHLPAGEYFKKFANDEQYSVDLKRFRTFLERIGSINMFAAYVTSDSPSPTVPYLTEILNKLIYGGQSRRVITDEASSLLSPPDSHTDSHTDADADADFGTVCRKDLNSVNIPFFLPHPELEVRSVSKEAYDSLCVLFELIQTDLSVTKISGKDSASWFRDLAGSLPWCACMSKTWEDDLKSKKMSSQYFVTSPKNILSSSDGLLVHFGLTLSPNIRIDEKKKTFFLISRKSESTDMILELLVWMSGQERIISSVAIMTKVYRLVSESMERADRPGDSYSDICDILTEGRRFLWIPDSKQDKTSGSGQFKLPLEWGSMIPLKNVVLENAKIFVPEGGPVTVLYEYYDEEGGGVRHLFSRTNRSRAIEKVCTACKVVEGMFGARGLPFINSRMRGKQQCECDDTGFGRCGCTLDLISFKMCNKASSMKLS